MRHSPFHHFTDGTYVCSQRGTDRPSTDYPWEGLARSVPMGVSADAVTNEFERTSIDVLYYPISA